MTIQRILFIELLGGIGDLLIALPAIQALGRSYPQATLDVICFPPGDSLLTHDTCVNSVFCAERDDARGAVERTLRGYTYDLVVSTTSYDGIDSVISTAGVPRTVTNLWRKPPPNQRVGDRFVRLLLADGVITPRAVAPPRLRITSEEQRVARDHIAGSARPLVFLMLDASIALKRWSLRSFVTLGRDLQQRHGATVLVVAGDDAAAAHHVAAEIGAGAQVWPRGSLREFAAALQQADLVVSGDTGPAHLAATLGTPTLTLFGPTWHERYGQATPQINLQGYPECTERVVANFTEQRCWRAGVCPLGLWANCTEAITPDVALAAAEQLLAIQPGRSRLGARMLGRKTATRYRTKV